MKQLFLVCIFGLSVGYSFAEGTEARISVTLNDGNTLSANIGTTEPLNIERLADETKWEIRVVEASEKEDFLSVLITRINPDGTEHYQEIEVFDTALSESVLGLKIAKKQIGGTASELQPTQCCRTCNGVRACGCKVESCLRCCCVKPCCPCPES